MAAACRNDWPMATICSALLLLLLHLSAAAGWHEQWHWQWLHCATVILRRWMGAAIAHALWHTVTTMDKAQLVW